VNLPNIIEHLPGGAIFENLHDPVLLAPVPPLLHCEVPLVQ
jgi:hypothetical protein